MAYGSLSGAITFALVVVLNENVYTANRQLMITTAILVIYVTNFLLVTVLHFLNTTACC